MQLKNLFSLRRFYKQERPLVKIWSYCFDVIMLIVMVWLPLQWYAEIHHLLSQTQLLIANWIVWGLFLLEFIVMISIVKNKIRYIKTDWLNIFIILAIFPPFWQQGSTYLALLRYLRIIILLRLILPQMYNIHRILTRNKFGMTLLVFILVTVVSGILVSFIDPHLGSPWKGIWWAWQTVTTVGYGDVIPHTLPGEIFSMILMLIGVGLFSLVTANVSAYFIERGQQPLKKQTRKQMKKELNEINTRINKLEESNKRIESLLIKHLNMIDNENINHQDD